MQVTGLYLADGRELTLWSNDEYRDIVAIIQPCEYPLSQNIVALDDDNAEEARALLAAQGIELVRLGGSWTRYFARRAKSKKKPLRGVRSG